MVKIITDTTATLSAETAQRYGICGIPQVVHFGTDSYREGIELDNATFMHKLRTCRELPKTAAPPPEVFVAEFRRWAPFGEPILCIHPSAEVSGTVRSALLAMAEFPRLDIRVLDTRTVGSPLGSMVVLAAQWAAAGEDADSIEARLRSLIPRVRIYFLVATLAYLARGGRIGGAAALLGSVLQVKPILTLRDGRVEKLEQERTQQRAVGRILELAVEQCPRDESAHLAVMHAASLDQALALAKDLARTLEVPEPPIVDMPPAIVTHGGPGLLGVGFFSAIQ